MWGKHILSRNPFIIDSKVAVNTTDLGIPWIIFVVLFCKLTSNMTGIWYWIDADFAFYQLVLRLKKLYSRTKPTGIVKIWIYLCTCTCLMWPYQFFLWSYYTGVNVQLSLSQVAVSFLTLLNSSTNLWTNTRSCCTPTCLKWIGNKSRLWMKS